MAVKKAAPKKVAEPKSAIVYQFADKEYDQASLTKIAKDVWKYDLNGKAADLKKIQLFQNHRIQFIHFLVANIAVVVVEKQYRVFAFNGM